jgi:hypothetical protein
MGWRPLRAARSGSLKRLEGFEERLLTLPEEIEASDAAAAERLTRALAARRNPAPPTIGGEAVSTLLASRGLVFAPLPPEGRAFGSPQDRREVGARLLSARRNLQYEKPLRAMTRLRGVRELDPDNLAALLSLGQIRAIARHPEGKELTGRGLELEPTNGEFLHWYAHALWPESVEAAEQLLQAILPFRPEDPDVLYDLACARSLAGDSPKSAEFLTKALRAGFDHWQHIESDPDLRHLRKSELWNEVLREFSR